MTEGTTKKGVKWERELRVGEELTKTMFIVVSQHATRKPKRRERGLQAMARTKRTILLCLPKYKRCRKLFLFDYSHPEPRNAL